MKKIIFILVLLFCNSYIFGQSKSGNVKLSVSLINDLDGEEIKKSSNIKVVSLPDVLDINPKAVKGKIVYEFKPGLKIKISVSANGFYGEEKILETAEMEEIESVEIRLKPNAGGTFLIKIIDKETKKAIQSNLEVTFFAKKSDFQLSPDVPMVQYSFDIDGKYELKASANNYIDQTKSVDLKKGAGVKDLVFELEKTKQSIDVMVMSQASNIPVPKGKATVTLKDKNLKIFDGEFTNGKFALSGVEGSMYSIFISAEGYNSLTETFKLGNTMQRFGLVANSTIRLDVYDEATNERIEGEVLVKNPQGKVTKIRSSKISEVVFTPSSTGNHTLETNFNGYINKTGAVNIENINGGSVFLTLKLKKGSNDYLISVFDGTTKLPIDFAKIKVFTDSNTEVQGRVIKNSKSVRLNPEKKHFFEVIAEGYLDYTQNMTEDKIMNVYLNKPKRDTLDSFYLQVLDSYNKLPVENAKLRVVENTKKVVSVTYDASNKKFVINKLDTKGIYITEAYAKGYTTLVDTLDMKNLPESITLVPNDFTKYKFITEDAFTKELINADVKITTQGYEMPMEKQAPVTVANLASVHAYMVDVSLLNYNTINKAINRQESAGNEFRYKLSKNAYKVNIKFNPVLPDSVMASLKGTTIATNSKTDALSKEIINEGGVFMNISPEVNYTLAINANGYEAFITSVSLSQVDNKTLSYTVTLKRKKEEKVVGKKEEKKVEEVKKTESTVLSPEAKAIVPGKRFPLEGVQFEKSKTIMTPGHEAKLQPLVDYLKANPKSTIEIIGHTDNDGSDQRLNVRLSEFRAKVVGNYLFNKGIVSSRIKTGGKGALEPLVPSDTEENRQKNRRIEAFITEN